MSSSNQSTNAATAISRAMSSSTKLAMDGSAAESTSPDVTPLSSEPTSALVPPATASLMASVADRLRMTIWTATTASNSARGSCTRKVRISWPGFCRTIACSVEASSMGRTTTPASAVIWP